LHYSSIQCGYWSRWLRLSARTPCRLHYSSIQCGYWNTRWFTATRRNITLALLFDPMWILKHTDYTVDTRSEPACITLRSNVDTET